MKTDVDSSAKPIETSRMTSKSELLRHDIESIVTYDNGEYYHGK